MTSPEPKPKYTTPAHVDVAILGAGTAGLTARAAAKREGASVVMIDPGPFGTTCARVGCMPSKLLIAAADAAHHAREAERFGVHVQGVQVVGSQVMARLQSERDRFVGFVLDSIEEARGQGELIEGRARAVAPGVLQVEGQGELRFASLVVATGTRPWLPPPFRNLGPSLLDNAGLFDLDALPESVLVVGLGAIGLELGQALHRLGVRTTLVGVGGAVGPLGDPQVLAEAKQVLSAELDMHPDYQLTSIEEVPGGVRVRFVDEAGEQRDARFERVLMAAGRRANLADLGLEALGIELDGEGEFELDADTLQLADHPVFLAGDVNQLHPLLHEAADDGRIAGANAARFPDVRAAQRRTPMGVVFSDPQIGVVGASYRELQDCHAAAGEVRYDDQGRARVQGFNRGMLRIYAEHKTGRLLGAELFGPRVEHLAHLLAWAVQQGLHVDDVLGMPFYHPVVEEGVRTALRDLQANLRHGAPLKCRVSEFGVGS